MATPEDRKTAFVDRVEPQWRGQIMNPGFTVGRIYDYLLKHFEETDQKPLADAVRYGTRPRLLDGLGPEKDRTVWVIDYPETED